jgi:UDP-3-O-[3-hydroxymyristoyl] glucosamine N-acyltransferase
MLKGLEEVEEELHNHNISFHLLIGEPTDELEKFSKNHGISTIITDFSPLRIGRNWRETLAKNVKIGYGNIIHNNVSISRSVVIKDFCLLLPAVVIGHDSKIDSFNILNASSTLGGFVNLCENCYLGQGSNLRDKIKVSKQSLIGMGSIITKNIKKKGKYFGII